MHNKIYLLAIVLTVTFAPAAHGGTFQYGRKAQTAAESFTQPMQCIVNSLIQEGYTPRDVSCYAQRPHNRSAHPSGHACDIDQTARNVTGVNRLGTVVQNAIAKSCGAVSGCIWRRPDCGHFEARSAPYSPAGAGVVSHYYGQYFASHPVQRRRFR